MSTLNNATAAQFMGRVASFSTHGSRRGYSDLGEALDDSQLNPYSERIGILARRLSVIRTEITALRRVYFGKNASIESIVKRGRSGVLSGNILDSALKLGKLRDEQLAIEPELIGLKQAKKEWNIINSCASGLTDAQFFVRAAKRTLSERDYLALWAVARELGASGER